MAYREHTVEQGECISSIAYQYGFFPDTIWNDSKNGALKQERKDPNVLLPGDRVYIRDKEEKEESCVSEAKHRFRRKGVPERLGIVVKQDGEPVADEPYSVEIDGQVQTGRTDKDGRIECVIPPDAASATLTIGEGASARFRTFELGSMNPVDKVSGVKARLSNLGYDCGPPGEAMDERTKEAIKAFQQKVGLDPSGDLDQSTRDALVREHKS